MSSSNLKDRGKRILGVPEVSIPTANSEQWITDIFANPVQRVRSSVILYAWWLIIRADARPFVTFEACFPLSNGLDDTVSVAYYYFACSL